MTREERAVQILNQRECCRECVVENCTCAECDEAFDLAIKVLEQEPVLDKIRAEIEEYKSRQLTLAISVDDLEKGKQIALEYVLAVLNKYKAESEE